MNISSRIRIMEVRISEDALYVRFYVLNGNSRRQRGVLPLITFTLQVIQDTSASLQASHRGLHTQDSPHSSWLQIFRPAPYIGQPFSDLPGSLRKGQEWLRWDLAEGVWSSQVMWCPRAAWVCPGPTPSPACCYFVWDIHWPHVRMQSGRRLENLVSWRKHVD